MSGTNGLPARPPLDPQPTLWYTSGTPAREGQQTCGMSRYLGYHAGPHGTGWRRRATAIPFATGLSLHTGLESIGRWLLEYQQAHPAAHLTEIPVEVIAWAATDAAGRYETRAQRGLLMAQNDIDTAGARQDLIDEQRTLVEALVWIWSLERLPGLLAEYQILDVEFEESTIIDCTCGLGAGITDHTAHEARGCQGILQQGRADWLLTRRETNAIAYIEFKSKSNQQVAWERAWEHSGQLSSNMEAASQRLGRPVETAYVDVLFKGWRGRDKNAPPEAPKYQHSLLCYGYFDEGSPGLRPSSWEPSFRYRDSTGKNRTLGKQFRRRPIWDTTAPLLECRPGASRVESWVSGILTPAERASCLKVLGPFPNPRSRAPLARQAIFAEEQVWRARVQALRAVGATMPDHPEIDAAVPRSWNCTSYDNVPCQFTGICNRDIGWEDPEGAGGFVRRRPHHALERAAYEALGVTFDDE